MFGIAGKKGDKPCSTIDTLVSAKTEFKGDIVFLGGLRIDGKVKGNITAKGDNSSTLILSEHAVVTGNINVPHMVVNGTVRGQVRASERLDVQAKAEITGDVAYKNLQIAFGAVINGNLICEADKPSVPKLKTVGSSTSAAPEA